MPFSGSTSGCVSTGTRVPNSGVSTSLADEIALALVIGVGEQRHARRDQLWAGRLDQGVARVSVAAIGRVEAHAVHRSGALAVLELGLRDGRLEVDVPQRRRLELVGLTALEQAEERALGDPLGARPDRRVGHRPVDRQPERAPELLERLLVARRQAQAELDEVRPRHRHGLLGLGLGRWGEVRGHTATDGSQRTPKWFCTRRSVGRPLSSQPIG